MITLPSPYAFVDRAESTVAQLRSSGDSTLTLTDASSFTDFPCPVSLFRSVDGQTETLSYVTLIATSKSGNTLTVSGVLEGDADSDCEVGDVAARVLISKDLDLLWQGLEVLQVAGDELDGRVGVLETTGGPVGPQGYQGVAGSNGPQGYQGVAGSNGPQGYQGVAGSNGPQGYQGVAGSNGPQGYQGVAGSNGPQGYQGVAGAVGPQGYQGVAGSSGPQGSQGVAGSSGPQGSQGVAGSNGAQGNQGVAGANGAQGYQGVAGVNGAQGNQGYQGATGLNSIGASVSGATSTRILYTQGGLLADNAGLRFDQTNTYLAVGTATPSAGLDISDGKGLKIRNASNSVVSLFDANGYGFVDRLTFSLARLSDLTTGTNLTKSGHIAGYNGIISKVKIQANVNGSSGGFTLQINKNGSSIFTSNPTVAVSTTTVQSFTPTTTSVAENDAFTIDCTSTGTGVQNILVALYLLIRNQ